MTDESLAIKILGNTPIQFWMCPLSHPTEPLRETVRWDGNVATCTDCGITNIQERPRPYARLLLQLLRSERQRWAELREWAGENEEVNTRMDEASATYAKRNAGELADFDRAELYAFAEQVCIGAIDNKSTRPLAHVVVDAILERLAHD